jgi:hypothetical protein
MTEYRRIHTYQSNGTRCGRVTLPCQWLRDKGDVIALEQVDENTIVIKFVE